MIRCLTLLFLTVTAAAALAAASPTTQIVVVSGDIAPGGGNVYTPADHPVIFTAFDHPVLNDRGRVAFRAGLDAFGPIGSNRAVYLGEATGNELVQIVQGGFENGRREELSSIYPIALNNSGQVTFTALTQLFIEPPSDGVFIGDEEVMGLIEVASEGQPIPGTNRFYDGLSNFSRLPFNNAGQVAFEATIGDSRWDFDSDERLYRGDGTASGLVEIAREDQITPDGNGRFFIFGALSEGSRLNDKGQVAFHAALRGTNDGGRIYEGLYRGDGTATGLVQVAREDQILPDGEGVFRGFNSLSLNDAGEVAFLASLASAARSNAGIYLSDASGTSLVKMARLGDASPDGNGRFRHFGDLALNNDAQVVFRGSLTDTINGAADDLGIYIGDGTGTGLAQVVREGQAAPDGRGRFHDFNAPALNDAGQIAFRASLTDATGELTDDTGIFLHDEARGLLEVARLGDALLGSTITSFGFDVAAIDEEEPIALNRFGQVAFRFDLADGRSGIALWSVPEPASSLLIAAAAALLPHRRGSRAKH